MEYHNQPNNVSSHQFLPGNSTHPTPNYAPPPQHVDDPQFDIIEWYPKYQSCQRYFTHHAQHGIPVQAVAAFINILLPYQRTPTSPANQSSVQSMFGSPTPNPYSPGSQNPPQYPTLIPYLRRLIATGMDAPGMLHGFFGDDWVAGVGPLHESERRNYLFAAKSGGWASVKKDYDMLPMETVPFLRPLSSPVDAEITGAEKVWSEWLAMEDWMVGPRAPETMGEASSSSQGRERRNTGR